MLRARFAWVLAAGALLLLPVASAYAQDFGMDDDAGPKVTVGEATLTRAEVPAGTSVDVQIPLSIVPEWHVYAVTEINSIPTHVTVAEWPEGLSEGATIITPEAHLFGPTGYEQMVHEGDIVLSLTVNVDADAATGARTLSGVIEWMACDAGSCLPPEKAEWTVTFTVAEGPKAVLGEVIAEPAVLAAGGSTRVRLPVKLADEWHIYGLAHEGVPTTVTVEEWPEGLSGGAVTESPPAVEHDNYGIMELIHEGEVTFSLTVEAAADAAPGPRTIKGVVGWMACNASMCLEPVKIPFEIRVQVGPAGAVGAAAAPVDGGGDGVSAPRKGEFEGGITLDLILQAILLGFITVLTPCVFPMLPITVSFFSKQEGPALPRSLV